MDEGWYCSEFNELTMKTIKKQLNSVALILSILILFQGCTVYKSIPISLEEASTMDNPVRVITKNNEKIKYDRIIKDNGNYYTVKNDNKVDVITPIDTKQIKEVKVVDKAGSIILTLGSILVIPVALLKIGFAIWPLAIGPGY